MSTDQPSNPTTVIDEMIIGRAEKRSFIRMNIESEVDFIHPGSNKACQGQTIDLSASGVRFTTREAIQVGETFDVVIRPKIDLTPPLEARLDVVRVQALDNHYEVAGTLTQDKP